jgi:pimeloyl-ACP methyl ester carboxylesterase
MDQETQTFTLSDGRIIAFAQYGNLTGIPIICNHGTPSCRLEYRFWDPAAKRLNARLIVPDRPGMGLSTHYRDRKLLDWPKDVEALMRHLKVDRYHVLGGSGGGPFALACAKQLPRSQMISVSVWAGAGPPEMGLRGSKFYSPGVTALEYVLRPETSLRP